MHVTERFLKLVSFETTSDDSCPDCPSTPGQKRLAQELVQQIAAAGIARAGVSSATVVVLMLPPMILFLILQSNVVETMAHSGLKD